MATIADQLPARTKKQLGVAETKKGIEEAVEQSIQARAGAASPSAVPLVWWFNSAGGGAWEVSPWWSPQRDRDLRSFWKKTGNDILQGAVSSMVKKFGAMNWTLEGPATTVKAMQSMLAEAEFGAGWSILLAKTLQDFLVVDRGAFWELIGKGDADGPMDGLPTGVAHLDACQCQLTGDPTWPVVFHGAKDGRAHKMHVSRVVHLSDLPSPNAEMKGVGFSATSRVIASSQILLMLSQYKREKLEDLPQAGMLVLNNVAPARWEDAQAEYERERRKLGNELWSNIMVLIGQDPAQPADAKFLSFSQIPDHFDEATSVTNYVNIVALAFGVDPREFWPVSSGALGTASESLIMHQKAKGKGVGDLISAIERAVNWKVLPPRVTFQFDYADDAEDMERAQIEDVRATTILKMFVPDAAGEMLATRAEIRQMLADNVGYFREEFLEVDVTQEREATDTDVEVEKMWGPVVVLDRKGKVRVPDAYKVLATREAAKQLPVGRALAPWEGQVEITPEDVAEAVRDWDEKAPPEWRGLLMTGEAGGA